MNTSSPYGPTARCWRDVLMLPGHDMKTGDTRGQRQTDQGEANETTLQFGVVSLPRLGGLVPALYLLLRVRITRVCVNLETSV